MRSLTGPGDAGPDRTGPEGPDDYGAHADDVELLVQVASGDQTAVRRLLDHVAPVVYGFVFARVGGNEPVAEDLLQETLLESVRSASGYRGDSALSTWMCAIARRRLARYYESERRAEIARSSLRLVASTPDAEVGEPLQRRDEVIRALGSMPASQRQVLVLKYLDELSVEEIASSLGKTRVQVQSLLQRARDKLRVQLGERSEEQDA